jgi:predicted RNA binding protein YcfA (HicA-like mRNA interferase family)
MKVFMKQEKLLKKAWNNSGDLAFADFETLLKQIGWVFIRQAGSHRIWKSPNGKMLPIQPDGSKAKEYQVKQLLRIMDEDGK